MIEINLLPEELKARPKTKKIGLNKIGFDIEARYFIYLILIVLGFLAFIHIYLAGLSLYKNNQLRALTRRWQGVAPQKKILDDFNKEYSIFSSEDRAVKQLLQARLGWAQKLNKLSLLLPAGVWFTDLALSSTDFTLNGSVVSLQKDDMSLINQFMDNLKHDPGFFSDFSSLELSSVQKKTLGGYDITDFILLGTLKPK